MPLITAVPCDGVVTDSMVRTWPLSLAGPALSLARTSTGVVPLSSRTMTLSASETGTSLTSVTVIDTVAAAESTVPSLTLNVKLSEPLTFRVGVYDTFVVQVRGDVPEQDTAPSADRLPPVGGVTIAKIMLPSTSVPDRLIVLAVSSAVVTDWEAAVGTSLTAVMGWRPWRCCW